MRLAEALSLRGDLQKRVAQLRERIHANVRFQEGEEPSEDATALLTEAGETIDRLQSLIAAINLTNASLTLKDGRSMTSALAARDMLKLRHSVLSGAAQSAITGADYHRQMRSELRQVIAIDVPALRREIDDVAQQLRELDTVIQEANWTSELVDN